ncbi:MAG: signal peptide peptidase SppA [Bdellovibrionales bacterium]|nr:signal peptide peptidase SppA [Bdellovibrionales bacterium]
MKKFFTVIGVIVSVMFVFSLLGAFFGLSKFGSIQGTVTENSILYLDLDGVIIDGKTFLKNLRKYRDDKHIKGVVVRVNSPGGVVGPSQEIYAELKRVREEWQKPVVVTVSSVAASGAYYAAIAANKVIVNPGSMLGSIGVIMEFANLEGLYNWANIKRFALKTGPYKDSGAEYRPMREDEKQLFQNLIDGVHTQFIDAVVESRKLEENVVRKYSDGRVFTGETAVSLGFADQVGTFDDAVRSVGELSGLGAKPKLFEPPKERPNVFDFLAEMKSSISIEESIERLTQMNLSGQPLLIFPGALRR